MPGLNGIRAIAAFGVIVSHINLLLDKFGLEKKGGLFLASFGVTMFFALSGFLITMLLLKELEKKGTVAIKKFYMRRVLRIWPLYFLYLLLVFITVGFNATGDTFLFYIFMMPNIPFAIDAAGGSLIAIPYLAHYWSLGVEEQFYAFWPWVLKYCRKILYFLIAFTLGFLALKFAIKFSGRFHELQTFLHYTRFDCLSMGGIGAYLLYSKSRILTVLKSKICEALAWFVLVLMILEKFHIYSIIDHEIIAFFTIVIIINQVDNPKRLLSLENAVFDYLGKISFGLYVYNPLVIYLMSFVFLELPFESTIVRTVMVYLLVIPTIVLVSHVSYFYFEKRFLKFKNIYSTIQSASSRNEL